MNVLFLNEFIFVLSQRVNNNILFDIVALTSHHVGNAYGSNERKMHERGIY